jgi:hypothetical protein
MVGVGQLCSKYFTVFVLLYGGLYGGFVTASGVFSVLFCVWLRIAFSEES